MDPFYPIVNIHYEKIARVVERKLFDQKYGKADKFQVALHDIAVSFNKF